MSVAGSSGYSIRVQNVVSTIETHGMKIAFRSSAAEGR